MLVFGLWIRCYVVDIWIVRVRCVEYKFGNIIGFYVIGVGIVEEVLFSWSLGY